MSEEPTTLAGHVQRFAYESKSAPDMLTPEARRSEAALKAYHPDMPTIVRDTANKLDEAGVDVGQSKATAYRLTGKLTTHMMREGQGPIHKETIEDIKKDSIRNVLVQEAASHEFETRTGEKDPLKRLIRDLGYGQGAAARTQLDKDGIDTRTLFSGMRNEDIRAISSGAYESVSVERKGALAQALQTDVEALRVNSLATDRGLARDTELTRRPNFGQARTAPSGFGRRDPQDDMRRQAAFAAVRGQASFGR